MSESNENQVPAYNVRIPERGFKFRVKDGVKKPSKAGKPMFELDVEMVDNAPVGLTDGRTVDVNGLEFRHWVTLTPNPRGEEPMASDFFKACGLPPITNNDLPGLDVAMLKGRVFYALAKTEEVDKKNENGEIITHPVTGQPIKQVNRKITQVLQLS
jgi:hypothetical protein